MDLCMIGTGYVGLVTGTLFADRGNNVVCVDKDPKVVKLLNDGQVHIFEPGLEELVRKNVANGRLSFTRDIEQPVAESDVIFIAVNTPSGDDGAFNLDYLKAAARDVGRAMRNAEGFKVVVGKSTVPQGTHQILSDIINEELSAASNVDWAYVSNPETLAEGSAVRDFESPERVMIGTYSDRAFEIMEKLYHPFNIREGRIQRGSPVDAELAKLISNTLLAKKVAAMNECSEVVDHTPGADMAKIRQMVCSDSRIGFRFMYPSPGYGGSCFPKDVQGLVHQARADGYEPALLSRIHESNEAHKAYMGARVVQLLDKKDHPRIGVWGVTFKPRTDDMRDSPSIPILTRLINEGAQIKVYDPQDAKARDEFGDKVEFVGGQYEAAEDADALILLTEWTDFDQPDFERLADTMRGRQLFDLRNRWRPEDANTAGFDYFGVGRSYPLER